jgi:hypothetical protein
MGDTKRGNIQIHYSVTVIVKPAILVSEERAREIVAAAQTHMRQLIMAAQKHNSPEVSATDCNGKNLFNYTE